MSDVIANNPSALEDAIIETLRYFDVQDHPLTLIEIQTYLLYVTADLESILSAVDRMKETVGESDGFYCLAGRESIIAKRISDSAYSIPRMRLVRRYLPLARHIPFIRAAALSGSEALSASKQGSDIDILLITAPKRIWTARFFATFLYQVLGIRRHGNVVVDRFCLNHYIAGSKHIQNDSNLYTAVEYASLVPFFGGEVISVFQEKNIDWISQYLPNFKVIQRLPSSGSLLQRTMEWLLNGHLGNLIERILGVMQRRRIVSQEYIIIEGDELSFHPGSKGQQVLRKFNGSRSITGY